MKNIKSIGFITIFTLITLVVFAYNDSFIDSTKQLYGYNQWVGITKTNYIHTITSVISNFTGSGFTLIHPPIVDEVEEGGFSCLYTLKNNILQNEIIDVKFDIRNDIVATHSYLMESFAYSSSLQPFPLGNVKSVFLGDRCYLNYATNENSSVSFVRNNVSLYIFLNDSTNSVLPFATWLDNKILEMSLD